MKDLIVGLVIFYNVILSVLTLGGKLYIDPGVCKLVTKHSVEFSTL